MDDLDTYWLAGLLEGEGCFSVLKKSYGTYPCIQLRMCDKDVVERACKVSGVGKVNGPYKQKNLNHQDHYIWQVTKREDVLNLLRRIYPMMGDRRQERIDEILDGQ